MLLGRTANGLYWMARYIERAENMARLVDAGLRMALTRNEGDVGTESHGRKSRSLGDRVKNKRQIAEGNLEALPAVMSDNHYMYCSISRGIML